MLDVIGISSAFVDYFFEGNQEFLQKYQLQPESDVFMAEKNLTIGKIEKELSLLAKSAGGCAPNVVALLAKLGMKAGYYGVIGKDKDSGIWKHQIGAVDFSCIIEKGTISQCACVLTNERKSRAFLSVMNPEEDIILQKIDFEYLNSAKYLHISPLLFDIEKALGVIEHVVEGVTQPLISFAPSVLYTRLGLKKLKNILAKTHFLFTNKNELHLLIPGDRKEATQRMLGYGPKVVICTDGENDVLVTTRDIQFSVPAQKVVKIVDSTGAGDAFAGAFLYGQLKNKTIGESVRFAHAIAAQSLSDFGLHWLPKLSV